MLVLVGVAKAKTSVMGGWFSRMSPGCVESDGLEVMTTGCHTEEMFL